MTDPGLVNAEIRNEADEILFTKGLYELLKAYGTPHITGSYELGLMTWRDLDIYIEASDIRESDFFQLGSEINLLLRPAKMSFRNETIGMTKGLPQGLYWGIYLGNERAGAWKIDVWMVSTDECQKLLQFTDEIKRKLTPGKRIQIMDIKSKCWQDPQYRRGFSSKDIYEAVLDKNVKDYNEFRVFLIDRNS